MHYLIVTFLLLLSLLVYFRVADRYNIVDKPNERSSHTVVTLRGGGIIIWFSALFYFLLNRDSGSLFFIGITLVSLVSLVDDIKNLSGRIRMLVQLMAVGLIFYDLNIYSYAWYVIIAAFVMAVGVMNAYNFMDGINGITGLYSVAVLLSFLYVNNYIIHFSDNDFLIYPLIACFIFLFFNYRKKATCFAGDIGSIAIAFFIIYSLSKLIIETGSFVWILFLSVYGVDSVCTILHRLYVKQNIFKPHRMHFYQILCNDFKIDHRFVSLAYAFVQGVISIVVIATYSKKYNSLITFTVLIPLTLIYFIKFVLMTKKPLNN